jgi:predicted Rossmann-fold nucleotide-binding protein
MLGIHLKPVALLSVGGYYEPLEALLDRARDQAFLRPEHREILLSDDDPARLVDRLAAWEPAYPSRWTPPEAPPA